MHGEHGAVTMTSLSTLAAKLESAAEMPSGGEERFIGFGVIGIPLASGLPGLGHPFQRRNLHHSRTRS